MFTYLLRHNSLLFLLFLQQQGKGHNYSIKVHKFLLYKEVSFGSPEDAVEFFWP